MHDVFAVPIEPDGAGTAAAHRQRRTKGETGQSAGVPYARSPA